MKSNSNLSIERGTIRNEPNPQLIIIRLFQLLFIQLCWSLFSNFDLDGDLSKKESNQNSHCVHTAMIQSFNFNNV